MKNNQNRKIFEIDGIRLSSTYSGMYNKKRLDLSIMEITKDAVVSGVFTKNKAKSDTITVSQKNLKKIIFIMFLI